MKVGTDGVLLGAWAPVLPSDRRVLDIGTGTGLIALMMAQRMPQARIAGVDIDDVSQARENADASPWGARLRPISSVRSPAPMRAAPPRAMPSICLSRRCATPCCGCSLPEAVSR